MLRLMYTSLVALLGLCCLQADDKKDFDAKKLEGKWSFVSGMKSGTESGEEMKKTAFEIAKDTMTMTLCRNALATAMISTTFVLAACIPPDKISAITDPSARSSAPTSTATSSS